MLSKFVFYHLKGGLKWAVFVLEFSSLNTAAGEGEGSGGRAYISYSTQNH